MEKKTGKSVTLIDGGPTFPLSAITVVAVVRKKKEREKIADESV